MNEMFLIVGMAAVLPALLEKLRGSLLERKNRAATNYRELVIAIADGIDQKPSEVEKILDSAGKSLEDLTEAVKVLEGRRADAEVLSKVEPAKQRMREIEAEIDRRRKAAWAAWEAELKTLEPLQDEFKQCERVTLAGTDARQRLGRSFNESGVLEHEKALRREHIALREKRKELIDILPDPETQFDGEHTTFGGGLRQQYKSLRNALVRAGGERQGVTLDIAELARAGKSEAIKEAAAAVQKFEESVLLPRRQYLERTIARMAEIDVELEAIEAKKLIPS